MLRGELEPRQEAERLAEVTGVIEPPRDARRYAMLSAM